MSEVVSGSTVRAGSGCLCCVTGCAGRAGVCAGVRAGAAGCAGRACVVAGVRGVAGVAGLVGLASRDAVRVAGVRVGVALFVAGAVTAGLAVVVVVLFRAVFWRTTLDAGTDAVFRSAEAVDATAGVRTCCACLAACSSGVGGVYSGKSARMILSS